MRVESSLEKVFVQRDFIEKHTSVVRNMYSAVKKVVTNLKTYGFLIPGQWRRGTKEGLVWSYFC